MKDKEDKSYKEGLTYKPLNEIEKTEYMLVGPKKIRLSKMFKENPDFSALGWSSDTIKKLNQTFGIPSERAEMIHRGGWLIVLRDNVTQIWTVPTDEPDCQCVLYKTMEMAS